jgi:hypothetical protein
MIWRMTWWGLVSGAVLGATYTVVFLLYDVAALLGMYIILLPLVLLTGARNGILVSLVAGPPAGLVVGLVTRLWFRSLTDARRYRLVIRWVGAGAGMIGAWLAMLVLTSKTLPVFSGATDVLSTIILHILPGPVAALAGWWTGSRVASWYITETLGWDQ